MGHGNCRRRRHGHGQVPRSGLHPHRAPKCARTGGQLTHGPVRCRTAGSWSPARRQASARQPLRVGPGWVLRSTSSAVTRSTATRLGRDVRRCAARRRPGVPPGWVDTHGVKEYLTKFRALTLPFLRSPEQGADTLVWLAATKPHSEGTERFWHDRRLRPTRLRSQRDQGPDKPRRLWIISARPPESPWPLAPPTRADRARPQRNLMHPAVAANRTAGTTTRYRGRPSCR